MRRKSIAVRRVPEPTLLAEDPAGPVTRASSSGVAQAPHLRRVARVEEQQ